MWNSKANKLFLFLGGFFIANALIAEFIGVKIFSLEKTLGFSPVDWTFFGQEGLSLNLTAGVLLWPVVFVMTDIINEYFGMKGVRLLSYLAAILIAYAFAVVFMSIDLIPADFWSTAHLFSFEGAEKAEISEQVGNYNTAYSLVFGQGLWIIIGSLVAFLVGQLIDVLAFHKIKQWTGEKKLWLRATGSTLISQFVDSYVVLGIAFYIGADWPLAQVLAIGTVNYVYKFIVALVLTPSLYLIHYGIDQYLGADLSNKLRVAAHAQSD